MKKKYFSHDADARNDEKCIALRMTLGLEGYGLYWCLIERLMQESDYTHSTDYNIIAFDMRCSNELVKAVVEDFGLFTRTEDGTRFYSESLIRRMLKVDEISARRSDAVRQRWANRDVKDANAQENGYKCNTNVQNSDTNVIQMYKNLPTKEGNKGSEVNTSQEPPGIESLDPRVRELLDRFVQSKAYHHRQIDPIQQANIIQAIFPYDIPEQMQILQMNTDADWKRFLIPDEVKDIQLAKIKDSERKQRAENAKRMAMEDNRQ